jgi:hypothetical protein
MSPRVAPAIAAASLAIALAACSAAATPTAAPTDAMHPVPVPSAVPTPAATTPVAPPITTPSIDAGNVTDSTAGPEVSIEPAGTGTIRVTLADPAARAWRIAVEGTGDHAGDAWVLTVQTGDVAPDITTIETANGVTGEPVVQEGLQAGTAKGRICAASLPVCVVASSVALPSGGNGTLGLELIRTDPAVAMNVAGSTAAWPADPFVLGPWTTTEAFPWEAGT